MSRPSIPQRSIAARAARFALVCVALAAAPASAELIQMDLAEEGDQLVVRDTETNLDWLHLSQTVGLSINDVRDGVDNDWLAEGWRYSTSAEICGLYEAVGYGFEPCPTPDTRPASVGPGTTPLGDLLGTTLNSFAYGIFEPFQATFAGYAWYQVGMVSSQHFAQRPALIAHGQRLGFRGHFLVREAPEPGAALGAAAAIGVVMVLRRRPASRQAR